MMKQTPLTVFNEKENTSDKEFNNIELRQLEKTEIFRSNSLTKDISTRINSKDIFFSLEFLPPRTHHGEIKLLERLQSIQDGGPLFCSVTWHSSGSDPGCERETPSSRLAAMMAASFNFHTMLHLAANDLTKDQVLYILQQAQLHGIRTILALRGDRDSGWNCPKNGFLHAVDLVRFIREKFGDIFTIGVAGYPSGHHEAESYTQDMKFLKEKVDAGADFIISQIFYSAEIFMKFCEDCKILDINVPVIPGVLPILSYTSFIRIADLCHLEIPPEILKCLSCIKHNGKAITNYGIHFAVKLAHEILKTNTVPAVHFYTLNREKPIISICKQLGLWPYEPSTYGIQFEYSITGDFKRFKTIYFNKTGLRTKEKCSDEEDFKIC